MNSLIEAIRSCDYLYLEFLTEFSVNQIRIVLLEAIAGPPTGHRLRTPIRRRMKPDQTVAERPFPRQRWPPPSRCPQPLAIDKTPTAPAREAGIPRSPSTRADHRRES
jgi:hypothetical protein